NNPENGNDEEAPDADDLADLSNTEMEARLVALRLRQLRAEQHPVWKQGKLEPVDWRDMAILLRSPRNKAESYAKVFESLGIPLVVARGGFFDSLEITDLLRLLQLLDNPLQDLPLLAVLRSPLAGLTLDELATIRSTQRRGYFWNALRRFHLAGRPAEFGPDPSGGHASPEVRSSRREEGLASESDMPNPKSEVERSSLRPAAAVQRVDRPSVSG